MGGSSDTVAHPANVAAAIAKLKGNSYFIGCVGKDPFGSFLVATLEQGLVNTSLVQRTDIFTTLAFVSLAEDGERDFVFARGADRELSYDPGLKELFKNQIIHFGAATALLGGSLEDAYSRYFRDALSSNGFICFDPNFRTDLWKGTEDNFIKKCIPFIERSHMGKFSLEEAQLISGRSDLREACTYLHNLGIKILTVTLGSNGTYLSTPAIKRIIPSIAVKPVDTTGAGDACIGCLLRQIAEMDDFESLYGLNGPLEEMVLLANKAGAITTTGYGAIESLPDQGQLDRA